MQKGEENKSNPQSEAVGKRSSAVPAPIPVHGAEELASVSARLEAEQLSTVELVREITSEVKRLAQKQIELAKAELKADIKAEAKTVGGLGVAALGGLTTVNLVFVTAVLALAEVIPGWLAGMVVAGVTLVATGIVAWVSWSRRVRAPLARTQRTLREDVQWTKERLV